MLLPVIDRLRERFGIGRVCVVADRGTTSAETVAGLEARNYIIGARERNDALVKNLVVKNDEPFAPLLIERQVTQLFVKEVKIDGKRYIVCRNESEAENDRQERKRIVAALDAQLKKGDKVLIGNSAYRRYLRKSRGTKDTSAFEIDAGKLAEEARFDGIFLGTLLAAPHCRQLLFIRDGAFQMTAQELSTILRRDLIPATRPCPRQGPDPHHPRPLNRIFAPYRLEYRVRERPPTIRLVYLDQ